MYFEFIEIKKSNRFPIANWEVITIRPQAKVQMVLGTNGSGKSSLLSIGFSPLPPDPKDFHTGGSWEVHIVNKGHRYELKATFKDKNRYSFIRDGEELNPGGTVTVQLDLVKDHLNYTRELHQLLTGQLKFTELSPQARRDWIARLSAADFTYAFKQYNRFRKGHSNAQAVSKFLQGRINEERQRLLDPNDEVEMRARIKELHAVLNELVRMPRAGLGSYSEIELQTEFESIVRSIEEWLSKEYPYAPTAEEGSFDQQLTRYAEIKNNLIGARNTRGEILSEIEQRLRRVEALMSNDPIELARTKDELESALRAIPDVSIAIHEDLLRPCPEVINELRMAIADLPSARVSNAELAQLNETLLAKKQALAKADNLLESIVSQIGYIERSQEVTCPGCNNTFKPGIEPGALAELHERCTKGSAFVNKLSQEANELQDKYTESAAIVDLYSQLENIRSRYLNAAPGLFLFLDSCGGMELGRGLFEKLSIYGREVENTAARKALVARLETVRVALEQYHQESGDYLTIKADYDKAVAEFEKIHRQIEEVSQKERGTQHRKQYSEWWASTYEHLMDVIESFKERVAGSIDHKGGQLVEELIGKTQTTLAINETALAENELIQSILKDLENQLTKSLIEEEAFKRLADAMSPKTGLIAEQITHQIGALVGGMNQMIKRVWGYPLYIQMTESTEADLDYRFPIVSEGVPREDVAKGSDSMVEIVNRAFALVAYYSLDLQDYPLFLDEPGRTFDPAHRHNLIPMIKDLVDCGRFSQVLIISHDPDNQTAFTSSETIIIDDRNITYPHAYNEHVAFA